VPKEVFEYYTYCLEIFATRKQISGLRAWMLFKESGADEYVMDNHDLQHTKGMDFKALKEKHTYE